MKKIIGILTIFLSVTFTMNAAAQKWTSFTNTDDIRGISIDSKGNEWFATTGGLKKFDGTNWTKYTNTNSGLHLSKLTSVAVDKQDRVWVGTNDGISVFDGSNWVKYNYENSGFYLKNITSIQVDDKGKIWVATDGYGVFIYDNISWQVLTTGNSSINCDTFFQLFILNGKYYFASACGLVIFDGTSWEIYNGSNSILPNGYVFSVSADNNGKVYCGTGVGLFVKDGTNFTVYNSTNSPINPPTEIVNSLYFDTLSNLLWVAHWDNSGRRLDTLNYKGIWGSCSASNEFGEINSFKQKNDESLWLATSRGIFSYKNKNWNNYISTVNELSSNGSVALKTDSTGVLWYGNIFGVDKYDGISWTQFDENNSPIRGNVEGILVDENNVKWFTNNGPLKKFDGVNWASYPIGRAYSSITDKKGTKWFGVVEEGVIKLESEIVTRYNTNPPITCGMVQGLDLDQNGNLWVGGIYGAQKFDGVNWESFNSSNSGLEKPNVNDLLVDKQGNIWFGCTGAVTRFDGTNWTSWYADGISGLKGDYIFDVEEDIDGTIWVGGTGISKFDGTKWITYTTKNSGLVSDYIRRISIDKLGNKWIASGDGGVSLFNDTPIPPTPIITVQGSNAICIGANVVLSSSANSGNQWYKDGLPILSNGTVQTYTANLSGSYSVKVTKNGIESLPSIASIITVNPKPVVSFNVNNASQVLTSNSFVFTNTSTNGNTYLWRFGNGSTATTSNASVSYAAEGNYVVKLVVTSAAGCSDSSSISVTVTTPPPPTSSNLFTNAATCMLFNAGTASKLTKICYSVKSGKVSAVTPSSFNYFTKVTAPSTSFTLTVSQSVNTSGFKLFTVESEYSLASNDKCSKVSLGSSPSTGQFQVKISGATIGKVYTIGVKYETKSLVGYITPGTATPVYTFTAKIGTTTISNSTGTITLYPNNCVGSPLTTSRFPQFSGIAGASSGEDMTGIKSELRLFIFPNPSIDLFNVKILGGNTTELGVLKVMNSIGQVLMEYGNIRSGEQVQLGRNLRRGVYLMEYKQLNKRVRTRLVKQ